MDNPNGLELKKDIVELSGAIEKLAKKEGIPESVILLMLSAEMGCDDGSGLKQVLENCLVKKGKMPNWISKVSNYYVDAKKEKED